MNTKMESQENSRKFEKQERLHQVERRRKSFRQPRWHYGQHYVEPVWHHQGWLGWQNHFPTNTQKFRPGGDKQYLTDITSPEPKQTLTRAPMVPVLMLVVGLVVILFHLPTIWDLICAALFPIETHEGAGR